MRKGVKVETNNPLKMEPNNALKVEPNNPLKLEPNNPLKMEPNNPLRGMFSSFIILPFNQLAIQNYTIFLPLISINMTFDFSSV